MSSVDSSGVAAATLVAFAGKSGSAEWDRSSHCLSPLSGDFDYCSFQLPSLTSSADLLGQTGFAD